MPLKLNQQTKSLLLVLLKLLVLAVIGFLLYEKLEDNENLLLNIFTEISNSLLSQHLLYLFVIVLMFFNWSLEAIKWKYLVRKITIISFRQSLRGVLAGLTLSFATPHGLGDYFGRILSIDVEQRERLIGSLLIGRTSQMVATAMFGLLGLQYLFGWIAMMILLGTVFIAMVICFWFLNLIKENFYFKKYFDLIHFYSHSEVLVVLGLALTRYFIFSLQFVIILYIFLPSLPFHLGLAGTTYIFLTKSVLPTINFLSDLGIREYAAIYFFEKFEVEVLPVLCASLTVWIVNILIPTIVGIPEMLALKWSRK